MMSNFALLDEVPLEGLLIPQKPWKINGSIAEYKSVYWCAYRTGNLDNFDAGNYLTQFDRQFNPVSHKRLIAENDNTAFEDVRLFTFNENLFAIYTYYPGNIEVGWKREYGVEIGIVNVASGCITHQQSLRKYSRDLHSKNWIPCVKNQELFIITDLDPQLRILKASGEAGEFLFEEYYNNKVDFAGWDFGQIRGSTPFICGLDQKWNYSFVHSHILLPNGIGFIRYYFFTILRIDLATMEVQCSKRPFGFSKTEKSAIYNKGWLEATRKVPIKVAFPMGLINYQMGVIVSYGKDDYVTRMKFYSWDFLISCF